MSNDVRISPAFLDLPHGKIFVTSFYPRRSTPDRRHAIVIVPPFAEEMNRSRRMIAEQARHLAKEGFQAYVVDLYGTGDSSGDFVEATWEKWCADLQAVVSHVVERDDGAYSLLGVRFGALLALNCGSSVAADARNIVLWQPCTSGRNYLRQFLRLRLATQLEADKRRRETIPGLMERFAAGEALEIAGYTLSSNLATAIESAGLEAAEVSQLPPITWFDLIPAIDAPQPAGTEQVARSWRGQGATVDTRTVHGAQFWSTVETTVVDELIPATTSAFVHA